MHTFRVRFIFFGFLLLLAACRPADSGELAQQLELEILKLSATPALPQESTPAPGLTPGELKVADLQETAPSPTTTLGPTIETGPQIEAHAVISSSLPVTQTMAVSTTVVMTATWDYRDVQAVRGGSVYQVSWLQDARLAVATSVGLFLYGADLIEPERTFNLGETVLSVAFVPRDNLLVSGYYNGDLQWRDIETGEYIATTSGHLYGVTDLAQAEGSMYLASGSDDGTVRTWLPTFALAPNASDPTWTSLWRAPDRVTSVDLNPIKALAAAGSYQSVSVWALEGGDLLQTLDGLIGWGNDLEFSPDGSQLAVADDSNHLMVWNTDDWAMTYDIPIEPCSQVTALDFNPDGSQLALGCKRGAVLIWDLSENTVYNPLVDYPVAVTDIAFHPFERTIISTYGDGVLRVWSLQP